MVDPLIKLCHCSNFSRCWGGIKDFLNCRKELGLDPDEISTGENLPDLFSDMNRKPNEDCD